jgi:hypothetical protein
MPDSRGKPNVKAAEWETQGQTAFGVRVRTLRASHAHSVGRISRSVRADLEIRPTWVAASGRVKE